MIVLYKIEAPDTNSGCSLTLFGRSPLPQDVRGFIGIISGCQRVGCSGSLGRTLEGATMFDEIRNDDDTQNKLAARWDADAVGLIPALRASGKKWFYLGCDTQLGEYRRFVEHQGQIMAWLNPEEQWRYNAGWFTLTDLQAWVTDSGPIMRVK